MKEEKYQIRSHRFLGRDNNGSCTYEITFNKSLDNTLRMQGMCKGLDKAELNEKKQHWFESLKTVLSIHKLFTSTTNTTK